MVKKKNYLPWIILGIVVLIILAFVGIKFTGKVSAADLSSVCTKSIANHECAARGYTHTYVLERQETEGSLLISCLKEDNGLHTQNFLIELDKDTLSICN